MDAERLHVVPKTDDPAAVAPGLLAHLSDLEDYMIADPSPDFRGWEVVLPDGRRVGKVSDLIVDTNEMVVKYIEVKVDEDVLVPRHPLTADTGEVYVLVPVGAARLADDEDAVIVDRLPRSGIEGAPRFARGVPTPEQERQLRDYYEPATRTADQRDGGLFDQRRFWGQRRAGREQSPYLTRGRSEAGSTATPVAAEMVVDAVVVEERAGRPDRSRPAR
jgi:sporulation protein YlmC with PRC-barrel domain